MNALKFLELVRLLENVTMFLEATNAFAHEGGNSTLLACFVWIQMNVRTAVNVLMAARYIFKLTLDSIELWRK